MTIAANEGTKNMKRQQTEASSEVINEKRNISIEIVNLFYVEVYIIE